MSTACLRTGRSVPGGYDVIDAVGFQGTGKGFYLGSPIPVPPALPYGQFAWVRKFLNGSPVHLDPENNAADFAYVSTNDNDAAHGNPVLGAPDPFDLLSPRVRDDLLQSGLLDPTVSESSPPNRILIPGTGGGPGTLIVNRTIYNCSGRFSNPVCRSATGGTTAQAIPALRFRITSLTTLGSPGAGPSQAVLEAAASSGETGRSGASTCSGSTAVRALPLDPPSAAGAGGLNSTWTVPASELPAGGIAPGECINVEFQFNVIQAGKFGFAFNSETPLAR